MKVYKNGLYANFFKKPSLRCKIINFAQPSQCKLKHNFFHKRMFAGIANNTAGTFGSANFVDTEILPLKKTG